MTTPFWLNDPTVLMKQEDIAKIWPAPSPRICVNVVFERPLQLSVGFYDTFGSWTLYVFEPQFSHLLRANLEVTQFTKAHGSSCQPKVYTKRY